MEFFGLDFRKKFFEKNEKSLVFLVLVFIGNIFIMNKSQRIYFSTGYTGNQNLDKYVKVKLEQDVETLEFMSMSLGTADVYQNFNADYGVLVGRVIANGGIGIPNARISIFIPLTDEDALNPELYSVYPYKTPRDENNEGKRYNLLPRVSKKDPITEIIKPKQPFGSFPIKEEVVANPPFLEAYNKYYKYTALTNKAGDYMIFGVPVGTKTVHLSCDITDIGEYSMNPASMVTNLGYSPNLFTDNNTRIKPSRDLGDLPNIETQEITVDIRPFWGDAEIFEIGITRQDFRIRSVLTNTFVIFGSVFTDGDNTMWSSDWEGGKHIREYFRARDPSENLFGVWNKRVGEVTEKIYYYPTNVSDEKIDTGDVEEDGSDMVLLDKSEYSVYKRDGDFVVIINCNRDKIITNELGNPVSVDNDSVQGIFTKFKGFLTLEVSDEVVPMNFSYELGNNLTVVPLRYKLKFPQYANRNHGLEPPNESTGDDTSDTNAWRLQHKTFEGGKFYSVAKFHGLTYNDHENDADQTEEDGFMEFSDNNIATRDPNWNVNILITETSGEKPNSDYQFPSNATLVGHGDLDVFGAAWLNLCVHLPQVGYSTDGWEDVRWVRTNDNFSHQKSREGTFGTIFRYLNNYFVGGNQQTIAALQFNTKWFARSDAHWTDIIEVPVTDILTMNDNVPSKGFTDDIITLSGAEYRNGDYIPPDWTVTDAAPMNGQKDGGDPTAGPDDTKYFYKGWGPSNCIAFLADLGII